MRVGIIGLGAIGATLLRALEADPSGAAQIVCVLVRESGLERARALLPSHVAVTCDPESFLTCGLDVVAECAGHAALMRHGPAVLAAGIDLVVASVGALADPALEAALRAAAASGGRLIIPAGAVGGLDALGAARRAGLSEVRYLSHKAPKAWVGTPAEQGVDLASLSAATPVFTGTAREAALAFPQNANVVAAVALAGLGFDRTTVTLIADPQAQGNRHRVEASGAFGRIAIEVEGRTLPDNPKTSMLAPYSLARAVLNLGSRVVV